EPPSLVESVPHRVETGERLDGNARDESIVDALVRRVPSLDLNLESCRDQAATGACQGTRDVRLGPGVAVKGEYHRAGAARLESRQGEPPRSDSREADRRQAALALGDVSL